MFSHVWTHLRDLQIQYYSSVRKGADFLLVQFLMADSVRTATEFVSNGICLPCAMPGNQPLLDF